MVLLRMFPPNALMQLPLPSRVLLNSGIQIIYGQSIIVIFDTSGTDDKKIRSRVIKARKCRACSIGILWSKDIRKERNLNIYNALIESSLLYGSETWRFTKNNKRLVEATEMDALRRSSRISRKERIRNVTIRQQIG